MDLQTKERRGKKTKRKGKWGMEPIIIGDPGGNYAMIMRDGDVAYTMLIAHGAEE